MNGRSVPCTQSVYVSHYCSAHRDQAPTDETKQQQSRYPPAERCVACVSDGKLKWRCTKRRAGSHLEVCAEHGKAKAWKRFPAAEQAAATAPAPVGGGGGGGATPSKQRPTPTVAAVVLAPSLTASRASSGSSSGEPPHHYVSAPPTAANGPTSLLLRVLKPRAKKPVTSSQPEPASTAGHAHMLHAVRDEGGKALSKLLSNALRDYDTEKTRNEFFRKWGDGGDFYTGKKQGELVRSKFAIASGQKQCEVDHIWEMQLVADALALAQLGFPGHRWDLHLLAKLASLFNDVTVNITVTTHQINRSKGAAVKKWRESQQREGFRAVAISNNEKLSPHIDLICVAMLEALVTIVLRLTQLSDEPRWQGDKPLLLAFAGVLQRLAGSQGLDLAPKTNDGMRTRAQAAAAAAQQ